MRVTVEIVPFGSEPNKHTVREVNIWNAGRVIHGDGSYCLYRFSDQDMETILSWSPRERQDLADGELVHSRPRGAEVLASLVLAHYEGRADGRDV